MVEWLANMVTGNLSASVSEKAKLLKHVHGKAEKLKYDVESLQCFLQVQSSNGGDRISKACMKRAREAAYDAEDVLDDYQLHFDDESSGGLFGLVHKKARGIQIASEIQEVRDKIKDIKVPENRRIGEGSNNLNSSNSNQASDPRLDALFVEDSELVGIDVPRSELMEKLSGEEESLVTISVVGMGGLGKTTLVKKVYDRAKRGGPNPPLRFEAFAWIPVSKTYKVTDLLTQMVVQFHKVRRRDIDAMAEIELIEKLRSFLENKRFLLVLDDIWDIGVWNSLQLALPERKNRSRVIITTRRGDVAEFCSDQIFQLQPLDPSEAWSLFCRKAFRSNDQEKCGSPGLQKLAYSVVKKCRGLPLAIVSLGSLLSVKPHAEWEMIHRSLGSKLETDDHLKSMKNILLLSFHDLPYHLKSCFLFLSIFPEDYRIKPRKLIRLWIAEGLVQSERGRSLEEVADGYLNQLVQRNLIEVEQWKFFTTPRTCQLHDLVREIILPKFEEEGFFSSSSSMELETMPSCNSTLRRLSIYSSEGDAIFPRYEKLTRLRSMFIFGVENASAAIASFPKMRWLRVVDIENVPLEAFPNELTHLPHLRYLRLENTKIKSLPNAVGKLKRLETLNLKGSFIRELPAAILQLQHLRHLLVYKYGQGKYPFQSMVSIRVPAGIGKLKSLQKLGCVEAESGIVAELEKLTELRRLSVVKLRTEDGSHLCNSVAKMSHLQALSVRSVDENELLDVQSLSSPFLSLQRLYLNGRLGDVPHWIHSLHNLVSLRLACCKLKDDPLKALQSLPSLVVLQLMNAHDGEELRCEAAGAYPNLKRLWLVDLTGLKQVNVENGAMSNLVEFRFWRCKQFQNVPLWLQHIPTIRDLDVRGMPVKFKQSLYKEGGKDLVDCVRHIRHIRINYQDAQET